MSVIEGLDQPQPMEPTFDESHYFQAMYSSRSVDGSPAQSSFDRARDRRITRLARLHLRCAWSEADVLDVGSAYGYLLRQFQGCRNRFGMDVSAHAVATAAANERHAIFTVADIQKEVPFGRSFDIVTAVNVVEHLTEPERGARNLASALHPRGVLIVHLPTISSALNAVIYKHTYDKDPTHVYRPSGREVVELFSDVGLRAVHASFLPYVPVLSRIPVYPAFLAAFIAR